MRLFDLGSDRIDEVKKRCDANRCCRCHQIREETNTKIDLPTENSNSEMIVITGKKSNCEAARDRILAIQRELVSDVMSIKWKYAELTVKY